MDNSRPKRKSLDGSAGGGGAVGGVGGGFCLQQVGMLHSDGDGALMEIEVVGGSR